MCHCVDITARRLVSVVRVAMAHVATEWCASPAPRLPWVHLALLASTVLQASRKTALQALLTTLAGATPQTFVCLVHRVDTAPPEVWRLQICACRALRSRAQALVLPYVGRGWLLLLRPTLRRLSPACRLTTYLLCISPAQQTNRMSAQRRPSCPYLPLVQSLPASFEPRGRQVAAAWLALWSVWS
jgi:hypothetical protein